MLCALASIFSRGLLEPCKQNGLLEQSFLPQFRSFRHSPASPADPQLLMGGFIPPVGRDGTDDRPDRGSKPSYSYVSVVAICMLHPYIRSISVFLFSIRRIAFCLLSSRSVMKTQNQAESSKKPQVNTTLFFKLSPALGL